MVYLAEEQTATPIDRAGLKLQLIVSKTTNHPDQKLIK
jgi:hypothetical protein